MTDLNAIAAAAVVGGNPEFSVLLTACRPMILSQIKCVGFRSALLQTEDLHQVANIAIHEALQTWKPEKAGFSNFAGQVVRFRLLSAMQRQGEAGAISLSIHANDFIDSIEECQPHSPEIAEQRETAAAALSRMSPRDRRIIEQIAEGIRYEDIGKPLGLNAKQVENIVMRVRRRARAERE